MLPSLQASDASCVHQTNAGCLPNCLTTILRCLWLYLGVFYNRCCVKQQVLWYEDLLPDRVLASRQNPYSVLFSLLLLLLADSFLFNWLDLLAFSLSGLKAEGTSCAAMAYVMADLHREGAKLGKLGVLNSSFKLCQSSVQGSERQQMRASPHVCL